MESNKKSDSDITIALETAATGAADAQTDKSPIGSQSQDFGQFRE
jgi:hypothetical protein